MAAPAPTRKPARGESVPVPEEVKAAGYTSIVNVFFDHLPKCVKGSAYQMLGIIYRETIGGTGRPEWIKISIKELADRLGCTEDGATKAADWLEKRKLSESKKSGKGRMYRALWQNWESAEPLPMRTLNNDVDEGEEDETEQSAEPTRLAERETIRFTVIPGSKAKPIDLPNGRLIPRFKCDFPVRLELTYKAGDLHLFSDLSKLRAEHPYSSTDVEGSNPGLKVVKKDPGRRGNIRTGVRMSEVLEALEPIFISRFHIVPDQEIVKKTTEALGDCPIDRFLYTVDGRMRRGRVEPALFPHLAADALKAWEKSKPQPSPEATQVPRVFEDESSNSLWMQIRLELKKRLNAQDYANWIAITAYRSFHLHEGKLTVTVPDDITVQWLTQEYAGLIVQIIHELGIPVKDIVYKVAGGKA